MDTQRDLFETLPNPHVVGTEASSRYEEMRAACIAFHKANPRVWVLFVQFTFDRINRGFANYSVNAVFERIRWETDQARVDPAQAFKLNNNHRPFYARAFMTRFPQAPEGFFRTRTQTSKASPATGLPELGPQDFQ